jgi:hypothetical protein
MVVAGKQSAAADAQELLYLKGSIEAVLDRCRFYHVSDASTPSLDATVRSAVLSKASEIASKGLRVVAMAYGFGSADDLAKPDGGELVFAGFQAMMDPPRRGVADAIAALQAAGIHVVMITGDAEQTAMSIARQLGMRVNTGTSSCLTGKAIDQMSQRQLQERIATVSVFARVTPKHKMSIISAFQANGDVVAMTGDGGQHLSPSFPLWFRALTCPRRARPQSTTRRRSRWPTLASRWARAGPTSPRRRPTSSSSTTTLRRSCPPSRRASRSSTTSRTFSSSSCRPPSPPSRSSPSRRCLASPTRSTRCRSSSSTSSWTVRQLRLGVVRLPAHRSTSY